MTPPAAAALILLTFATAYTAMIRRVGPGGLFAVVTAGLGRSCGAAAGWLAVLSYLALQISLYAALGAAAAPLFPFAVQWWQAAPICWVLVGLAGLLRFRTVSRLLAVLVLAEIAVIITLITLALLNPTAGHTFATADLLPHLDRPALGLLLATTVVTFVGFEVAAAFAVEAPRRAVTRATYAAVLLVALLSIAAASARVVSGTSLEAAATHLPGWADLPARGVLVAALFAAILALHHTTARYVATLAAARLLPHSLAGQIPPPTESSHLSAQPPAGVQHRRPSSLADYQAAPESRPFSLAELTRTTLTAPTARPLTFTGRLH